MAVTLGELAELIGGEVQGDASCVVSKVATLTAARAGDISFLSNPKYRKHLEQTSASAVIVSPREAERCPVNALVIEDPYVAYARVAAILNPPPPITPGVHPSAVVGDGCVIHPTAWVGPNSVIEGGAVIDAHTRIGPGCVVGAFAHVGADSLLVANVTICHHVIVGCRAVVHPGVVIGGDGFGLANDKGRWVKIPQVGTVRIGDDVEIGANTTIDRGAIEDTIIEDGVKLDNLIQIGHNVTIGAHTAIASMAGISGSTKIGKYCTIAGAVGIAGHLEIADHVHLTGMAMVTKSIKEPGVYSSGIPAELNSVWRKNIARIRKLDQLAEKVRTLEANANKKG